MIPTVFHFHAYIFNYLYVFLQQAQYPPSPLGVQPGYGFSMGQLPFPLFPMPCDIICEHGGLFFANISVSNQPVRPGVMPGAMPSPGMSSGGMSPPGIPPSGMPPPGVRPGGMPGALGAPIGLPGGGVPTTTRPSGMGPTMPPGGGGVGGGGGGGGGSTTSKFLNN